MTPYPALLEARLLPALQRVAGPAAAAQVTQAADSRFGDYQSNAAMVLAKGLKQNPRELAAAVLDALEADDLCESVSIAGPGFLNFTLRPEVLAERVHHLATDPRLGIAPVPFPRRIVLDYGAPNVAKPMHVGHLRTLVIGHALDRTARFLGHQVISDNHIGDWGTQFGFVIHGWKTDLDVARLEAAPIQEMLRLYRETQAKAKADPAFFAECRAEVVRLQSGDPENLGIWEQLVALTMREHEAIFQRFHIRFDHALGESFYNDRLAPLVERLFAAGIARESEGAICLFFPEDPKLADHPCLIRKSDGGFLYATTDLATVDYRVAEWQADAIWYVVGAPQQLHLQQVFAGARLMGHTVELAHVAFGSILGPDRKLMRTRSGENVLLADLLEEAVVRAQTIIADKNPGLSERERASIAEMIGIGAVTYAELSQHRMTDYIFDFDRMLSFQGNTAPYLQNAYVRTRSIFRRLEETGGRFDFSTVEVMITTPEERILALALARFAETVPAVLDDFRPNLLAHYLFELAGYFHAFFEQCPVLKADPPVRDSRLLLCRLTGDTLRLGLDLLGIQVPEKM